MIVWPKLILTLVFVAAVLALQVLLSRAESKWLGLILPALAVLFSLLYPLNMAAPATGVTVGFVAKMAVVWLLANIPTVILLGIYFACRKRRRVKKQVEKMNIQDLD